MFGNIIIKKSGTFLSNIVELDTKQIKVKIMVGKKKTSVFSILEFIMGLFISKYGM